ncbi:tyrosine-type recombinase/integrase [Fodinisporobacter ferrooxydans]|uniref:Tyrosine-type recombinase/integrase n=1 Tax=Fodinisporobacter ferrooxydans TaxID=2901836 RepID=A0ABY4CPJ9_9BACL|nr:tyrosine-type recombinase/integrase [Alicyclobacillaceae bacterium MYW30-H2]UOF92425.1 tyrosine-type recombinase/integrase [Alicyclobacillaceae bacterium MYW30-H2]
MAEHQYTDFSESTGFAYCDEAFGSHTLTDNISEKNRMKLRAIRMLISYQRDGDFEFRTPSVERIFHGEIGKTTELYLSYVRNILRLSDETIRNKEQYLYEFHTFLNGHALLLEDLNVDIVENFFASMGYSLASRHNSGSTLRIFLRYAFDNGLTNKDCSIFVLADNYKKHCKLPTTYEESEISNMIASVERSSAIGKRDYLILLLAAEYGWRTKDIVGFRFTQIDWDNNVIRFNQSKTDIPVEFPLLSTIGNAIIDYLKHGRPKTDAEEIIVAADTVKKGQPLSPPTVHSIVSKYMSKANIKNWKAKKHGAHSLRHSLATNMLKKNVSMPVISTVMGHQSTETTKIYLAVDVKKLRQCSLPMPELHSSYFSWEA